VTRKREELRGNVFVLGTLSGKRWGNSLGCVQEAIGDRDLELEEN
jgi:hypothetical protein